MKTQINFVFFLLLIVLTACATEDITSETAERQALLVDVEEVINKSIRQTLELNGQALPSQVFPLFTQVPLTVEEVHKQVGEAVEKGDVIITLNNDIAVQQLNQAKKVVTELERTLAQAKQLNNRASASIEHVQALETEMNQSLERIRQLVNELQAENADVSLLEFIRHSLELSIKQAELSQAAGSLQQLPSINTMEIEMQLEGARENVRQAEVVLAATKLTAPIDGTIGQLDVSANQTAIPNTPLATVVALDPITATFAANHFQIGYLSRGMEVEVMIDGLNERVTSSITTVAPVVNPETNTFPIEIQIANPNEQIKGGMKATALIDLGTIEEATVVPIHAVMYDDNVPYTFVVNQDHVRKKELILGTRDGQYIEVLDGLTVNEIVVTTGKERLTDGAKITIRNE